MAKKKKMKYGVSGLAWVKLNLKNINQPRLRHIAFVVEAYSQAEAYGIGTGLLLKTYPTSDYENHSVVTTPNGDITSLENFDPKAVKEFSIF